MIRPQVIKERTKVIGCLLTYVLHASIATISHLQLKKEELDQLKQENNNNI